MKTTKKILLIASTFALTVSTAPCALYLLRLNAAVKANEDSYVLTIDKDNRLDGGNVSTRGGTNIHFDEYGVNENVGGGLLELAAYGSICLQTYISGISKVEVWSEVAEGKDFYLTTGATPNSAEFTWQSTDGHCSLKLKDGFENDCFYFSVHNKTNNPITINQINIEYSCVDSEIDLIKTIDDHLLVPTTITYNGSPHNPYYGYDIDPSLIPSNRRLIKTMSEDEYPTAPGKYTFGYEVYDIDSTTNQARKLLYTRTRTFQIIGMNIEPPDSRKVITFHIPDENGNEKLIFQTITSGTTYDITNIPEECLKYSWDSPYNSFHGIGDEHYYPVFRVNGLSSMKDGDGCYPVNVTYSYLERGFEMPEPKMKLGYRFGGWYLDPELTKIFDPDKPHYGNLTLYAKCIETDLNVKRVYYHNEDGSLADHMDYLLSDDTKVTLPEAKDIMDLPRTMIPFYWAIFVGTTYKGLYKQTSASQEITGDKIKYSDFSNEVGDVHIYATEVKRIYDLSFVYDLFSEDAEGNNIYQHTLMASSFKRDYDFVIPGLAVRPRDNGEYHDQADSFTVDRTGQFFMTDEKKAYVIDGGTIKTIASYAYGNIEMPKPLAGILRHETVRKVGRRAFFNRYGLKGTYFPRNATEFEIEAYANVTFNRILTLPKNLTRIGDRCFIGAQNITFVCLPRSIKSIGPDAFAYGTYNRDTRVFENISNSAYVFLYEGSEAEFNKLDNVTQAAVKDNAAKIIYNYSYGTYYGRG